MKREREKKKLYIRNSVVLETVIQKQSFSNYDKQEKKERRNFVIMYRSFSLENDF